MKTEYSEKEKQILQQLGINPEDLMRSVETSFSPSEEDYQKNRQELATKEEIEKIESLKTQVKK